ncbi:MAG: hypothetical protein RIE52_01045 [Balneola sp.]
MYTFLRIRVEGQKKSDYEDRAGLENDMRKWEWHQLHVLNFVACFAGISKL